MSDEKTDVPATPTPTPEYVLRARDERLMVAIESVPPGPMRLLLIPDVRAALRANAEAMVDGDFVPDSFRGKRTDDEGVRYRRAVANTQTAMLLAAQLGESPLDIMNGVYFVQGRVGWSAEMLRARLFRRHGVRLRFEVERGDTPVRGTYKVVEWNNRQRSEREVAFDGPDMTVRAIGRFPGEPEPFVAEVSMAEALADGWVSNEKYKTIPERMLKQRATTYWISLYAPDVKAGLPDEHAVEARAAAELPPPSVTQVPHDAVAALTAAVGRLPDAEPPWEATPEDMSSTTPGLTARAWALHERATAAQRRAAKEAAAIDQKANPATMSEGDLTAYIAELELLADGAK